LTYLFLPYGWGGSEEPPLLCLIAGLGESGGDGRREPVDHYDPSALRRLPWSLILAAGLGPVDELIPVGRRSTYKMYP